MDWILEPWPWYVAGPLIAVIMFGLLYFGKTFGLSSNLRTMCSAIGGGRYTDFFVFNWKNQGWNLVFLVGTVIGGFLAFQYLTQDPSIEISSTTKASLRELGIANPGSSYLPDELFGLDALLSFKGIALLVIGGFMVGFGARYAGGCTSGHAITGLSNLQVPSLIAVIGFFAGGLIMTYLILPLIFGA